MSALWHDADYVPEQRFETPLVEKRLEDMALPGEQHQLPDGVTDPFAKLDQVYDVAAAQMERGIKGAAFLHGKPPVTETTDSSPSLPRRRSGEDVQRIQAPKPLEQRVVESVRTDLEQ